VTVEDSMSMVHASHGDGCHPRRRRCAARSRSSPDSARRCSARTSAGGRWARTIAVIRKHIEHVVPGFHAFEERAESPEGSCCRGRRTTPARSRPRPARRGFTVNLPTATEVPPGALLLQTVRSHDQFNTTVYGSTTVTAASTAGAGSSSSTSADLLPRAARRRQGRPDQRMEGRRAARRRLPRGRLPDDEGLRRGVLPRGQRAGAARLRRRDQQHPRVQVGAGAP
jgi:hypothetical protein